MKDNHHLSFRAAHIHELVPLNKLIKASKGYWGDSEAFCQQFIDEYGLTEGYLKKGCVDVLVLKDELIGVVGMSQHEQSPMLDYFFLRPDKIGSGLGRFMWDYVLQISSQKHWASFQLYSNPEAQAIYHHFGARKISELESFPGRYVPIMQYSLSS